MYAHILRQFGLFIVGGLIGFTVRRALKTETPFQFWRGLLIASGLILAVAVLAYWFD